MVPYFYISKKNRSLLLVWDYRNLNQHIIKDKTPLLGQLTGFTKFCRLLQPLESPKYIDITNKYK